MNSPPVRLALVAPLLAAAGVALLLGGVSTGAPEPSGARTDADRVTRARDREAHPVRHEPTSMPPLPFPTRRIAPGITLAQGSVDGPNLVHVVVFDPSSGAALDVAAAGRDLPATDQTSDIAAREGAIVAVNGDYGLFPSRPGHALAVDGELLQTSPLGTANGKAFAVRQDGTASYLGYPRLSITVDRPEGPSLRVARWNDGPPRHHELAGFTAYGGQLERPSAGGCLAKLAPAGPASWGSAHARIARAYTVTTRRCGGRALPVGDGVVLVSAAGGAGATRIRSLAPGQTVTLAWWSGWRGVTEMIGGSPVLVDDGEVVAEQCDSYLCGRQPRTAIGITEDGHVLLVVIDGRWRGHSEGMTLVQEAAFLRSLGARWALNLDGGGSSTLWIRGEGIVNHPSDGDERSVSTAVLILPGRDADEPDLEGVRQSPSPPALD